MKHEKKTLKMILTMLFVGLVISASSWAFAQEGSISGTVKDLSDNRGISGVIVKVKDASTSFIAGTGITDALGNYLVNIPSLGNYIILVSKLGYGNVRTSDVIELSDMTPNWTVDISMGGKLWLMNKPYRTDSPRLAGTVGLVYTLLGDTRFGAVE